MPAQVRLLGPDLGSPLVLEVNPDDTILALKTKALESWPSGMEVPLVGQLRIIYQGRFMNDSQSLKECKVAEGETTAMHLIIKSQSAKAESAPSGSDDKAPKCSCIVC